MTGGGFSVTSGEADFWRWFDHPRSGPLLTVALGALALVAVNVASELAEAGRGGADLAIWAPFVWEFSSFLVIVPMAPLIGAAVRRWPPRRDGVARFVVIHGALTIPFAAVHIVGIFGLRTLVYGLTGSRYSFFDGGLAARCLYEWRKDVLVYAGIALVYALFQSRRSPAQQADDRIEIREGASAVFLAPRDVLWIEAAGNYVEFHTAHRAHLVRGTLASWQAKLHDRAFVRAHRGRLVNRARIASLKATPSGDVAITLDDGRQVLGSRRYRSALTP